MLTQSPANHKINSQVKRASSLLESYPEVAVQVQGEGGWEAREGRKSGKEKKPKNLSKLSPFKEEGSY